MEGALWLTVFAAIVGIAFSIFLFCLVIRFLWSVPSSLKRIADTLEEISEKE